jgi:hypothetical protein
MLYQLSHFRSKTTVGGAESQDRTGDTAIFSRVLYQLSYLGPIDRPSWTPAGRARIPRTFRGLQGRVQSLADGRRGRTKRRSRGPIQARCRVVFAYAELDADRIARPVA